MSIKLKKDRSGSFSATVTSTYPVNSQTAERLQVLSQIRSEATLLKSRIEYAIVRNNMQARIDLCNLRTLMAELETLA